MEIKNTYTEKSVVDKFIENYGQITVTSMRYARGEDRFYIGIFGNTQEVDNVLSNQDNENQVAKLHEFTTDADIFPAVTAPNLTIGIRRLTEKVENIMKRFTNDEQSTYTEAVSVLFSYYVEWNDRGNMSAEALHKCEQDLRDLLQQYKNKPK